MTPAPWSQRDGRNLRVIVLGSGDRDDIRAEAERMSELIRERADIVLTDLKYEQDLSQVEADFAIVFGGDGSILRAARQMKENQIPVVGVNLGKLGFLADLQPSEFESAFPDLCKGDCRVVNHLMFRCEIWRDGKLICDDLGLNETAVLGGPPFSILNIELYVDQELATTYSCDGLIISTPVGSTAHSLSAGGPILRKRIEAFVISPISPHTLTIRPVVDTADQVYEMVVREPNPATSVVVDGRLLSRLQPNDRVRVRRAENEFKMIETFSRNYYRTLREKLGWGGNLTEGK
ncbi:MAG: NAD(+)/NADH kinase [bacterium]|nr:NAD(+)/NADH kinase [bacterium]